MSVKNFSKLFLFQYKYRCRLPKFPNYVSNPQFSISTNSEPTVNESQLKEFSNEKLTIPTFNKTKGSGHEKLSLVHLYLSKHYEKYDLVNYENMDLMEGTNCKSLLLLKNLVEKLNPEEPEMNTIPEELMNCIENECSNYSFDDILKYIILTSKVPNGDGRKTLIKYLNDELLKRRSKVNRKEHLKILYLSAVLLKENYYNFDDFKYTRKRLRYLGEKIKSMTPEQMVVLFSIMRRLPDDCLRNHRFGITSSLLENVPNFNLDELIIISKGFFITNLEITNFFAVPVAKKLMEEIGNPHELPIFWLFKVIGAGAYFFGYDEMEAFQQKILPHAGKYEGKDLIYLARTGEKIGYVNLSLWEILANNFKKNIKKYGLYDIEKLVRMTIICNIQDEELLKMCIEEFQNADKSTSREPLIAFVYDLIHHQIYSEELLSLVLSNDFRSKCKIESFTVATKRKYYFINNFIKLHRPESNFEFVESNIERQLQRLFKVYLLEFGNLSCFETTKCILFSLENIYGKNFLCLTSFQPHFYRGIAMRFNKNLEAQPIPEEFLLSKEKYKRALNDDHIWLFIMVVNRYHYKQDTDIPSFETQTQLRELEDFGYTPVLIPNDLRILRKKNQDSDDYLKDILKKKLEEVKNKQRAGI